MARSLAIAPLLLTDTRDLEKQEKALTGSLKSAVQTLDTHLLHVCGKAGPSSEAVNETIDQTQVHAGGHRLGDEGVEAKVLQELLDEAGDGQPKRSNKNCTTEKDDAERSAQNEIVELGKARFRGVDASCQMGWSENVADKSCQAHDLDAALARLRWAARDFSLRKVETSIWHKAKLDLKSDMEIAKRILHQMTAYRAQTEEQVSAATRAKEIFLEKKLRAKRHDQSTLCPPIPPLIMQWAEHDDKLPRGRKGCFGSAMKGAHAEAQETQRKKMEEHSMLVSRHFTELNQQLDHAKMLQSEAEEELLTVYTQNIDAAQHNLHSLVRMAEEFTPLEMLRSGDSARERLEILTLKRTVDMLQVKVDELQEVLAGTELEWKRQVEELERRDRLSVQEDIETRSRALAAEKALSLAFEQIRQLERMATHSKVAASVQPKQTSDEVLRLREELHKSKATVAALTASTAFFQSRHVSSKLGDGGMGGMQGALQNSGVGGGRNAEGDGNGVHCTAGELTAVSFADSVLEQSIGQLQEAMDCFSPEWKHELELRAVKRNSAPCSDLTLHRDALGDGGGWKGLARLDQAAGDQGKSCSKFSRDIPSASSARDLSLADLMSSRKKQTLTHSHDTTGTLQMLVTMSILSTRNMEGICVLHEPYMTVEVDGQKIPSQTVEGGVTLLEARNYSFCASQTSIICLSLCAWTSDSSKAIRGMVQVAITNVVPTNMGYSSKVLQKDWFALHDTDGALVRTKEGVAAIEILLSIHAKL